VLVLDEAQILTEKAMEDMVPATNAAPNGLVLMMGTPPRPADPGEVFTSRREAALSGDDSDVLYVELSADKDCSPDDRRQWAHGTAGPLLDNPVTRVSNVLVAGKAKRTGFDHPAPFPVAVAEWCGKLI